MLDFTNADDHGDFICYNFTAKFGWIRISLGRKGVAPHIDCSDVSADEIATAVSMAKSLHEGALCW
jgi:hypothetical protein